MIKTKSEGIRKRQRTQLKQVQNQQSGNESLDEENELTKVKIGRIPYGWYDQFKHFGYDKNLQKVTKQKQNDMITQFIKKSENKDWWRTIRDELNQRDIRLSDKQLQLIDRIRSGKMASKTIANTNYEVKYDYDDPFPVHAHPPSKKNFMPSKWQQMKVNKILDGLLSGRIKWNQDQPEQNQDDKLFDAWASGSTTDRGVLNIAPMKQKLPGHNQSYNPPKQYLLTDQQLKEWQEMDQQDRPYNFIPTCFQKMRHIPLYDRLIQQRFQRCLDLYLCPRVKKKKLNIDPDSLIPKLPDSSTLRPFPTSLNISYFGHQSSIISLSVSPQGTYVASGDQSGLIIVWQSQTSKALWKKQYEQPIFSIDWSHKNIIGFSHGSHIQLMVWKYPRTAKGQAEELIQQSKIAANLSKSQSWTYYEQNSAQYRQGLRTKISFGDEQKTHVQFEKSKGDYFVTVAPDNAKKNEVIVIHRLSKADSQTNFLKGSGLFKKVSFYPGKPQLVILTTSKVVIFNLEELSTTKKLTSGDNTYATMSVHPTQPYIMVGVQNSKVLCFDLDLSSKPYKSMTFHEKTVTSIDYHREYPLLATASNDATIHVFHFKGQSQTLQQAIILPLKVLRGHTVRSFQGVKCIKFHPKQPWIFSAGKDGKLLLWT